MTNIEPTWPRGMYGCPRDMYDLAAVHEAERAAVIEALDAMDDLASDIGYANALDTTRQAYTPTTRATS